MNRRERTNLRPVVAGILLIALGVVVGYLLTIRLQSSEVSAPPPAPGPETANRESREPVEALSQEPDEGENVSRPNELADSEPVVAESTITLFEHLEGSNEGVPGVNVKAEFPDEHTETFTTDDHGKIRISGPPGARLEVSIESPHWRFIQPGKVPQSVDVYLPRSGNGANVQRLRVGEVKAYSVRVEYEDGVPFDGIVKLIPESFSAGPRDQQVSGGELSAVLTTRSLRGRSTAWKVQVPSRRPGFRSVFVQLELPVNDAPQQVVTLPAYADEYMDERGVLEIEFVADPEDTPVRLDVAPLEDSSRKHDPRPRTNSTRATSYSKGRLPANVRHSTTPLLPGEYVVRAWSDVNETGSLARPDPMLAARDVVEILPGQITTVRLRMHKWGSATALVVDPEGKPIPRARLARAHCRYTSWKTKGDRPPGYNNTQFSGSMAYALADEDGVVTLPRLAPGMHRLICDAEGHEQKFVEVVIDEGRTFDCGSIELGEAPGSIVVEVVHDEIGQDAEFTVTISLSPNTHLEPTTHVGKRFVIDKLPFGTFRVYLSCPGSGYEAREVGRWRDRTRWVTLSESSPKGTVRFEMVKSPDE